MNMIIKLLALSLSLFSFLAFAEPDPRVLESRKAVKELGGQLKAKLIQAMQEAGPAKAIQVCHTQAPIITKELSDKYDWQIGRTSLKTRNMENRPDKWELPVLLEFEKRLAQGEDIKNLEYYEELPSDEGTLFRYMKAIPTQGKCLLCHGPNVDAELYENIQTLYPADQAVGFNEGDIRGAFTIQAIQPK